MATGLRHPHGVGCRSTRPPGHPQEDPRQTKSGPARGRSPKLHTVSCPLTRSSSGFPAWRVAKRLGALTRPEHTIHAAPDGREARPHPGASPTVPPHQRSEKLRIYRAIPTGSRRAKSQPAFMRDLDARIDEETSLGKLRCDAATNTRSITWLIVRYTDWRTLTCRIGWNNLADLSGLSESTVKRVIRRLRSWGFLGVVETGSTWRTRGCRQDDEEGHRGAEYVLCVPAHEPVEISDPPSLLRQEERNKPHVRARENTPESDDRPWPMHQPPETRGQRLAATQRLQQQAPVLARLTDKQLRSVLRPWYVRGWSAAQVLYALDHTPDGQARWHTADVRHVAGWIRSRLAAWDGHTPPRQLGAGRTTDLTADDVAALPRADAEPVADTEKHASLARRLLAATLKGRSEKKPARGLGISLPAGDSGLEPVAEIRPPADRNPYDVDDPRHRYAEAADKDAADWLLKGAARRAEPDTLPKLGALAEFRIERRASA